MKVSYQVNYRTLCPLFFRLIVTKKQQESAHAHSLVGTLNGESRACADSHCFL